MTALWTLYTKIAIEMQTSNFSMAKSVVLRRIELEIGLCCGISNHWNVKEQTNKKTCIWEKVDPMWWFVVTIHDILSTEYGMNKIPDIAYKYILIENAFSIQLNYHFGNSSLFYMACTVLLSLIVCCYFLLDICANFCLFSFSTMRAK